MDTDYVMTTNDVTGYRRGDTLRPEHADHDNIRFFLAGGLIVSREQFDAEAARLAAQKQAQLDEEMARRLAAEAATQDASQVTVTERSQDAGQPPTPPPDSGTPTDPEAPRTDPGAPEGTSGDVPPQG